MLAFYCCCNELQVWWFKQCKFVLLLFWRSEIHNQFYAKIMYWQGLDPSESSREISVSLPIPASWIAFLYFLIMALFFILKANSLVTCLSSHCLLFLCQISLCLSLLSTIIIAFKFHLVIQGSILFRRSLTYSQSA